jgi:DNA-binding CsgD family transcriptional regulator
MQYFRVISRWPETCAVDGLRTPLVGSLSGLAFNRGEELYSEDVLLDRRPMVRVYAARSGSKGIYVVPLRVGNQVLGTLNMGSQKSSWRLSESQRTWVRTLCELLAIAILAYSPLRPAPSSSDASGESAAPMPPVASDKVPVWPATEGGLTIRQKQLARLLVAGTPLKEIAGELRLSPRTVEHHVERLKRRFGAPTLHGLVGVLSQRV